MPGKPRRPCREVEDDGSPLGLATGATSQMLTSQTYHYSDGGSLSGTIIMLGGGCSGNRGAVLLPGTEQMGVRCKNLFWPPRAHFLTNLLQIWWKHAYGIGASYRLKKVMS